MGEVFAGRYELVDPIGRGGVGAVWRSWDHRRRRYVAAKVLQQSDAHALLRFVREQAMRIDHPHVLAPASWAADDDKVLFTMDLVRGGSLSHLIGDYGPLPPRFVCVLLDQLLAGLSAVHAEGVIHRDIKPANILLEATGTGLPHVRLSDFGIAMRKGDARLTETDFVVGTPGYFAPEQMLGSEPDVPADLYAVGLVALYLLGGQKPDSLAIAERFLAMGTPPAPIGVPEPLWQVIAALLQPDPHARFRTATGARKALATAVELLAEPAPGEEPVEIFDQIGPLPGGFGPDGPLVRSTGSDRQPPAVDLSAGFPLPPPQGPSVHLPAGRPSPRHAAGRSTAAMPAAAVPGGPEARHLRQDPRQEPGRDPGQAYPPPHAAQLNAEPIQAQQGQQAQAQAQQSFAAPPAVEPAHNAPADPQRPDPADPAGPSPVGAPGGPLTHTRTQAAGHLGHMGHHPSVDPAAPVKVPPPTEAPPAPARTTALTRAESAARTAQPLPEHAGTGAGAGAGAGAGVGTGINARAAATDDTASAAVRARRPTPGPPPRVVVTVLVLAVVCFAIGIVALLLS